MRRRKCWSCSVGDYKDIRVYVYEAGNGMLYARTRERGKETEKRHTLGHRDRAAAAAWADEHHAKLRLALASPNVPTAGRVLGAFLDRKREECPDRKSKARLTHERCAEFWLAALGKACHLEDELDHDTLDRIVRQRLSGAIDQRGRSVAVDRRRPVRARTPAADLEWLRAACRWALTKKKANGRPLLRINPMAGYELPRERNPRRPVATADRYEATRAKAPEVLMTVPVDGERVSVPSYLPEILDISNGAGRRISPVVSLRYENLRLGEGPHGAICWPADTDKMGKEWLTPINAVVRAALDRALAQRPGIGAAYLFPSPRNPRRHVSADLVSAWLEQAERLAGLPKLDGSLWHAYRRKWATERKHLPDKDVAAAGGWSDTTSLKAAYQQVDMATLQRVVSEPAELREKKA
jgi:integrase-like protein